MVKKVLKMLTLFILLFCVLSSVLKINVQADYSSEISAALSNVDAGNDSAPGKDSVDKVIAIIITIARIVGVTVAIVMLLVIAMKYMTAAPGEKADIKKSAVVYVVGAIVLFAVTGILGIINSFSGAITATNIN